MGCIYSFICYCCCDCIEPKDDWNIRQEAFAQERGAGTLNKRAKSKAIWSTRFIVLTNTKLVYYASADRQNAKGEIVIAGASAQKSTTRPDAKKKKYFQISHPECGTREFYATSTNKRNQWVEAINDLSTSLRTTAVYGKLYKQGGLAKSSWQERWSICAGNSLDYFETATDNQPKGSIDLLGAKIKELSLKDQKYCIELQANNADKKKGLKKYIFCVEGESDRQRWIKSLNKATQPIEICSLDDLENGVNPLAPTPGSNAEGGDVEMSVRGDSIVTVSTGPDEKQGYLMKKSPSVMQGYQKRFFYLRNPGELAYYASEEDMMANAEPKGVIELKDMTSENNIEYNGKAELIIRTEKSKRSYPLKASNAEEAQEWVDALKQWYKHIST